jgi:hypothetical protein
MAGDAADARALRQMCAPLLRGAAERRRGVNAHSVLVSQVRFGD